MVRDEMVVYPRRRLSLERLLYVAVIGVLLFIVYRLVFPACVWVVSVNGRTMAVVPNERIAHGVLNALKKDYFPERSDLVDFVQRVNVQPIEARGERVMQWSQAQEKLSQVLQPAVRVHLIVVAGKPLVTVPTAADAEQCLEKVRAYYVPRGARLLSAQFKERVHVKPIFLSAGQARKALQTQKEAVTVLTGPALKPTSYTVQRGDTLTRIARHFGVTVSDLQYHNPGLDVRRLRVGDPVIVGGGDPPLTVITQVEETQLVDATPPWTVRQLTPSLPRGTVELVERGSPAKQRVRLRITYVNGKEQVRRATYEDIVQEAVPRKILVGTG